MNEELLALYEECQYPDWDGYSAFPVQRITLCHVQTFISLLPAQLQPTSCGADPDGAITLEWYKHPRQVLSVSIDAYNTLCWASLIGYTSSKGTEKFNSQISEQLINLISEIFQETNKDLND